MLPASFSLSFWLPLLALFVAVACGLNLTPFALQLVTAPSRIMLAQKLGGLATNGKCLITWREPCYA